MGGMTPDTLAPPPLRRLELNNILAYCRGRNGLNDLHNEDGVLVHPTTHGTILAVVDGVTPLYEARVPHPDTPGATVSPGWMGTYIVLKHLRELEPGMDMGDLMAAIFAEQDAMRREFIHAGFLHEDEILSAVFVVHVPWAGECGQIWRFGDPLWAYRSLRGWTHVPVEGNSNDAELRVDSILQQFAGLGLSPEQVGDIPPYQLGSIVHTAWSEMKAARRVRSRQSWLHTLDGAMAHVAAPVNLPSDIDRLVLASDGFLLPEECHSIDEGLAFLAELRKDPLMLGLNRWGLKTAKGFVGFDGTIHPYTDDVGIVVARP